MIQIGHGAGQEGGFAFAFKVWSILGNYTFRPHTDEALTPAEIVRLV